MNVVLFPMLYVFVSYNDLVMLYDESKFMRQTKINREVNTMPMSVDPAMLPHGLSSAQCFGSARSSVKTFFIFYDFLVLFYVFYINFCWLDFDFRYRKIKFERNFIVEVCAIRARLFMVPTLLLQRIDVAVLLPSSITVESDTMNISVLSGIRIFSIHKSKKLLLVDIQYFS